MENLEEWLNQLEERVLHYDVLVDKLKNEVRGTMKKEEDIEKQRDEEKHEEDGWKKSLEAYDKLCKIELEKVL